MDIFEMGNTFGKILTEVIFRSITESDKQNAFSTKVSTARNTADALMNNLAHYALDENVPRDNRVIAFRVFSAINDADEKLKQELINKSVERFIDFKTHIT